MAKFFPLLAAFFISVVVIQAQAPDGAALASRGLDAIAANLVNPVCASCHSLERVNGKKADRDGRDAAVARLKGLCANLILMSRFQSSSIF
jgi:hypothetical protein